MGGEAAEKRRPEAERGVLRPAQLVDAAPHQPAGQRPVHGLEPEADDPVRPARTAAMSRRAGEAGTKPLKDLTTVMGRRMGRHGRRCMFWF